MAFTSWRDVGTEVRASWPTMELRDSAVPSLTERFPGITLAKSGRLGLKISCRDASQVFFVRELIRGSLDGRA